MAKTREARILLSRRREKKEERIGMESSSKRWPWDRLTHGSFHPSLVTRRISSSIYSLSHLRSEIPPPLPSASYSSGLCNRQLAAAITLLPPRDIFSYLSWCTSAAQVEGCTRAIRSPLGSIMPANPPPLIGSLVIFIVIKCLFYPFIGTKDR